MKETLSRTIACAGLSLVIAFLTGCATAKTPHQKLHHTIAANPTAALPRTLVFLPVDFTMYEVSAGGIQEEVPDWTKSAQENVTAAVRDYFKSINIPLKDLPQEIESASKAVIDEHVALYDKVADTAYLHTSREIEHHYWPEKAKHFDYTIGPGLDSLREKLGADGALIVTGQDIVATAGRRTVAIVGALLGAVVPIDRSYLVGGIVDFKTGNVLWLNLTVRGVGRDFRKPEDATAMTQSVFADFPLKEKATPNASK
jgi:hypothetical protein